MLAELKAIRKGVYHAPTMGDAGENRWRQFMRDHLPHRYQIEKAHVIDSNGKMSEQIDCVIFDRQYSNLVFNQDGVIYVPAESVYAVFELKQNITKQQIEYAGKKIRSVRVLKRTTVAVPQITGKFKKKTLRPIIGGIIAVVSDYKPAFGTGFKKNFSAMKGLWKIDIVFSLQDGLSNAPQSEVGLILLLNALLHELQKVGNAPAIDYRAYSKAAKQ